MYVGTKFSVFIVMKYDQQYANPCYAIIFYFFNCKLYT